MRIVMLGDIVGVCGRQSVQQLIPRIHEQFKPDVLLANAENVANGSGLTPDQYRKLCNAGIDGMTMGDHALRKREIFTILNEESNIIRPCNLPSGAPGKGLMAIQPKNQNLPPVYVMIVLGNMFMGLNANDPFASVDAMLEQIPRNTREKAVILVEMHAETTSEKQAMGWYLNGKVSAVYGSHTHVPTADADLLPAGRIADKRTAFLCDLGMCGGHESVIGRRIEPVLTHLRTGVYMAFDVSDKDPRINGICLEIDITTGSALSIERFTMQADPSKPPFMA
jgi:metallophosphoesterase (TIGR00282 family)